MICDSDFFARRFKFRDKSDLDRVSLDIPSRKLYGQISFLGSHLTHAASTLLK